MVESAGALLLVTVQRELKDYGIKFSDDDDAARREVKKVQEIEHFFQAAAVILLYQLNHLDTGPTAFILPTKVMNLVGILLMKRK